MLLVALVKTFNSYPNSIDVGFKKGKFYPKNFLADS